nr:Ankyrin domain containing protein [Haemonchus contortus]
MFCFNGCRKDVKSRNDIQLEFLEYCLVGDVSKVREMLDTNKVDPKYRHPVNGWTALHWAAHCGNTKVCLLLLERGFSENSRDRHNQTPWEVCPEDNTLLKEILRPRSVRIEEVMAEVNSKRRSSTGTDNNNRFAPKYVKKPPLSSSKAVSFDSGSSLPISPTTKTGGYYLYGRRDSINKTRFLLVRTSHGDGKQAFKRVTLPGGSTVMQLRKMIEKSMRNGVVKSIWTLPDKVLVEDDSQIAQFADCQKVEVEYDPSPVDPGPAVVAESG